MLATAGLGVAILCGQTPPTTAPGTLTFSKGVFEIAIDGKRERIPIKVSTPTPQTKVLIRSDDTVIALDQRGITIQRGSRARSTRLADFITSPRFFQRETIVERVQKITSGELSREYAAVSGYEQIDNDFFIAVRWQDKKGVAYQEALVRVELDGTALLPEIVAPLNGVSIAKGSMDDVLHTIGNGVGLLSRVEGQWGLDTWSFGMSSSSFAPVAEGDPTVRFVQGGKTMLYVNRTSFGMFQAGLVELPSGDRTLFTESRTPIQFVGERPSVVRMDSTSAVTLRSLTSGLELVLPKDVGTATASTGVLVWTPAAAPTAAVLYDSESLRAVVRWNAARPATTRRT